jgi:hypothetical protein
MGFTVSVEADHGNTRLPTDEGGKAVFAFLGGLAWYCIVTEDEVEADLLRAWREWFKQLQTFVQQPLCQVFEPIMNCMWGDGGGLGGDFREDEYEWYLKRNPDPAYRMTEAEFQQFIQEGEKRWSMIEAVLANIRLLLDLFKTSALGDIEALYSAEDTVPDFESLYDTLLILKNFGYRTVRLNFA